jgi:hypothetical protein
LFISNTARVRGEETHPDVLNAVGRHLATLPRRRFPMKIKQVTAKLIQKETKRRRKCRIFADLLLQENKTQVKVFVTREEQFIARCFRVVCLNRHADSLQP